MMFRDAQAKRSGRHTARRRACEGAVCQFPFWFAVSGPIF